MSGSSSPQGNDTFASQIARNRIEADDITITVTVFNRREFVFKAITSALNQTVPVKVMVVEDCGPDPELRSMIESHFGRQISYYRNEKRRGLFGNWNVCLALCTTPWLSILHDDDYLAPDFVEAMQELAQALPECGIYFSSVVEVAEWDDPGTSSRFAAKKAFHKVDPRALAYINEVLFPGQLFRVECARAFGGFRESSQFCGDWEMWFKLAYRYGAARTSRQVAFARGHAGSERGTNKVVRCGRKHALDFVQAKRNLALLRDKESLPPFDRRKYMQNSPLPSTLFIQNARFMSRRLLWYNHRLFLLSRAPHWRYRALQAAARLFGPGFIQALSFFAPSTSPLLRRLQNSR